MERIGREDALALLGFWEDAGVDTMTRGDAPAWRDVQALLRARRSASADETVSAPSSPADPAAPVARPQIRPQAAAAISSLDELEDAYRARAAHRSAVHVAATGPVGAPIMILGDRATREDREEKTPLAGPAGAMLGKMLAALGLEGERRGLLDPAHVPGARPDPASFAELADLARAHVRLARPELLLLFGDAPARALLDTPLAKARGRVHDIEGVRTVVTFHPRWLAKRPGDKAMAWADLLMLTA